MPSMAASWRAGCAITRRAIPRRPPDRRRSAPALPLQSVWWPSAVRPSVEAAPPSTRDMSGRATALRRPEATPVPSSRPRRRASPDLLLRCWRIVATSCPSPFFRAAAALAKQARELATGPMQEDPDAPFSKTKRRGNLAMIGAFDIGQPHQLALLRVELLEHARHVEAQREIRPGRPT